MKATLQKTCTRETLSGINLFVSSMRSVGISVVGDKSKQNLMEGDDQKMILFSSTSTFLNNLTFSEFVR